MPGVYQSPGPVEGGVCYWKRSNGDGTVANAMTKKPQTVQIEAGDTTFKSSECQEWQKTDAPPPPNPSPVDIIGQLGSLLGGGSAERRLTGSLFGSPRYPRNVVIADARSGDVDVDRFW